MAVEPAGNFQGPGFAWLARTGWFRFHTALLAPLNLKTAVLASCSSLQGVKTPGLTEWTGAASAAETHAVCELTILPIHFSKHGCMSFHSFAW
jgi:hypothetical protein